ncbi:MAG: hypothetical protein QXF82_07160 [Nitrososphaeria archaeon]
MQIINLTPHEIKIVLDNGGTIAVPPSGTVARVTTTLTKQGYIDGIPVYVTEFGEVEGLPEPQADTIYIVSALVLGAISRERTDVYAPLTAKAVRDENGNIIGVPGLTR